MAVPLARAPFPAAGGGWLVAAGRAAAAARAPRGHAPPSSGDPGARRHFAYKEKARKSVHRAFESQRPYHKEILDASPDTLMQAQMYTPEVLKSDGLTRNCHRLVAWGLSMPELLDRYGDRAAELAATLTPNQFAVILKAFAQAQHRHDKMLKAFTKRMPPRLPHFLPLNHATVCAAYATLLEKEDGLFRRLSAEMPHKLPLFEGRHIALVANAYARLEMRDELLFDDFADEVIRRPHELDHMDLVRVASAFGHFRIRNHRLWLVLADHLLNCYIDLQAKEIASVLNAMSAVDFKHDSLLRTLSACLCEPDILAEMEPSSLGLALNAFARLQWSGQGSAEAVQALAERAIEVSDRLTATAVAQVMHSCRRLPELRDHPALVTSLLERAKHLVPESCPHSLSLLVNGCAKLRVRDLPLLTQVAKSITPRVSDFSPQSLAMTAHGFAKLEIRSEILFYLLAGEIVEKMPLFSGQGVGMVLGAYGKLGIKHTRLVQACQKQARSLADELTLQEVTDIEAGLQSLDALDSASAPLFRRLRRQLAAESAATSSPSSHTGGGGPDDPFALARDAFLDRLADEDDVPMEATTRAASGVEGGAPARPSDVEATSSDVALPRKGTRSIAAGGGVGGDTPDLWDLWTPSSSSSASASTPSSAPGGRGIPRGSEAAGGEPDDDSDWLIGRAVSREVAGMTSVPRASDATPSAQLREYLARSGRPGRRAVVLGGDGAGAGPAGEREFKEEGPPGSGAEADGGGRGRKRSRQRGGEAT